MDVDVDVRNIDLRASSIFFGQFQNRGINFEKLLAECLFNYENVLAYKSVWVGLRKLLSG